MRNDVPIIVLGMPRSGTTLVRRILNAHPSISCPGESFVLRSAARFLRSERVADGIDYGVLGGLGALSFSAEDVYARLREMCLSWHRDIAESEGKRRIAIKTAVDSFHIRDFAPAFDGHVKYVIVLRHGLDVACSLNEFCGAMEGYIEELMPYIERYRRPMPAFVSAWSDVTANMLDLLERQPGDAYCMRYEDLAADPERAVAALFGFLGEDMDENLLTRTFAPGEVKGLGDYKTYSFKTIEQGSVNRWHELGPRVISEISDAINPMLRRAGYPALTASVETGDHSEAMRRHELAMLLQQTRAQQPGNQA